jgi:hypothetical protein
MFRLSALLLAAAASAEEVCLDEESSLMQEAKKPAKTNRRDSKPLAGLLESARGFLTNGATPDVINFTLTALAEVESTIIPALLDESVSDQAWMDAERARFQGAIDELIASNVAVFEWNHEEVQASTEHKTCRVQERVKCDAKRNCEMELYRLWLQWVQEETELREIHARIEEHFCAQDEHGNYIANGTQHTFRVGSVPWMTSYTEQKTDCDLAQATYDTQVGVCIAPNLELDHESATCNAKLEDLEGKACAHASAISGTLTLFHAAWASLHASYQGITDLVYRQTQDRHQEYNTLVIVQCLLDRVTQYNGRPCDETTGTVDENMAHCEERGETLTVCTEQPTLCPNYIPPPETPPYCDDRHSVTGACLPAPITRPDCTVQGSTPWYTAEMEPLPALPQPVFTETNPGCNAYPDCGECSGGFEDWFATPESAADALGPLHQCGTETNPATCGVYHTWVEPPASFALETATRSYSTAADEYALRYSFAGASVDGCSSDNTNSRDYQGDQSGQAIPLVVHGADDTAAVRCCSHDGGSCISTVAGVCYDAATFRNAISICSSVGMRLCSQAELGTGVCCGTGCWFNHFATWISDGTPAVEPTHYTMVDGCLNQNTEVPRAVVSSDSDEVASVRCCSMDGVTCDSDHLPGGCQEDKTFSEAVAICEANGERLCTEEEIIDRRCCGTGCGFDGHQVWVSA